eukprot:CAMPEP_0176076978 /NCGR_PEP_ID=MMETSP0120_2-20121206/38487_1 /TAXON_ID=160619 /ORGANISM="Kryptoperidinium foliaceum, Strain CCMP 1326" /LENGTH=395 /DNA_ID=CAMNT_0017410707 /DNA_START=65 /DNA_END=1249 /DNA_ORIENTATION=+
MAFRLRALVRVAVAAALGVHAVAMAQEAEEALVEDDVCSSEEGCDLSFRQLRAAHRRVEARSEESSDSQAGLHAESLANGISTGAHAEVVGESSETGGQLLRLYHQTSAEAGESILREGFRLGSGGLCGAAIYFSPSPKDTDVKAVGGRGFIIEAVVDMGRMKVMSGMCDNDMTAERMKQLGFDSITLDRGGFRECWFLPHCYEYIVYDKSRIKSMKGYAYNGWASWFPWMGGWGRPGQASGQPSGYPAEVVGESVAPAVPPVDVAKAKKATEEEEGEESGAERAAPAVSPAASAPVAPAAAGKPAPPHAVEPPPTSTAGPTASAPARDDAAAAAAAKSAAAVAPVAAAPDDERRPCLGRMKDIEAPMRGRSKDLERLWCEAQSERPICFALRAA